MPREERDYLDHIRQRQLLWNLAGIVMCVLALGAVLFRILGTGTRSQGWGTLSVVAGFAALACGIAIWRSRRPSSRWPARASVIAATCALCLYIFREVPTLFRIFVTIIPVGIAVAGGWLFFLGLAARKGDTLFCAACGYEQAPGSADRCPECATRWLRPGATVKGEKVANIPRVAIGVVAVIAGLGLARLAQRHISDVARLSPTSVLLAHLPIASHAEAKAIVAELDQRTFSSSRLMPLAERALNRRKRNRYGFTSPATMDWLVSKWRVGDLDDAFIDRFAAESAELSLRVAGIPKVGTPLTIEVGCASRMHGSTHKVVVVIESLTLDDGSELVGQATSYQYPNLLESSMFPQYAVRATHTPAAPGTRRAVLAYWLFVTDGRPGLLQWTTVEGVTTPIFIDAPRAGTPKPIWSTRHTTSLDISVSP